jgi:HEAT repeat protein
LLTVTLAILLQSRRWQLDTRSLFIGIAAGFVLGALFAFVIWPWWRQTLAGARAGWQRLERRLRSGGLGSYLEGVAAYAAHQHPFGADYSLSQFFVAPLLWAPVDPDSPDGEPDDGLARLHRLWPETTAAAAVPAPPLVSLAACLRHGRRVLIAAEPGAGKSTLLAAAAHACASADAAGDWAYLAGEVPLFLHVADLAAAGWPDEPEAFAQALPVIVERLNRKALAKTLAEKLSSGEALLLLDGADELTSEGLLLVADWLRSWLARYPKTRMLVAAPARGYAPLLSPGCVLSGLLPWRGSSAETFGRRWSAMMGQPLMPLRRYWRPGQLPWHTAVRLQGLALLQGEDEPPERWVERAELALRAHLPAGAETPAWLAPVCRELWQQLAQDLALTGRFSLDEAAFAERASALLAQYDVNPGLSMRRLRAAAQSSGLFVTIGGRWRFASPLWRDFLAAAALSQTADIKAVAPFLDEPARAALVRFSVGRLGAEDLAEQRLAQTASDPLQEGLFQLSTWLPELLEPGAWRRTVLLRLGRLAMHEKAPLALRQRAVLALAQTAEEGVLTLLRQQLEAGAVPIKTAVLAALAAVEGDAALDLLLAHAEDDEPELHAGAMVALGWRYQQAARKPIIRGLLAEDARVQRTAAETLALNGGEDAKILVEAAEDKDPQVRRAAAFGLSLVADPWAEPLLERLRRDELWIVQSGADMALSARDGSRFGWQPVAVADQPWLIDWAAAKGRGVPGGEAALGLLLEAVAPAEPAAIRRLALRLLGALAHIEAVPVLQSIRPEDEPEAQMLAYETLCEISRAHGGWVGA